MELVLIRHGQPEWVRQQRSVINPPLTELGHRQAAHLAKALAGEQFDEFYVSPLVRAHQTAAPVLVELGVAEVVAPWLEEIRDPDWHGQPFEQARSAYEELRARHAPQMWSGLPGGEATDAFVERVRTGALEFLAEHGIRFVEEDHGLPIWELDEPRRRVGLVAHAGTNSVIIGVLLGLTPTPWEWDRLPMMHASVSRLDARPVGRHYAFRLLQLSNVEHLAPDHRTA